MPLLVPVSMTVSMTVTVTVVVTVTVTVVVSMPMPVIVPVIVPMPVVVAMCERVELAMQRVIGSRQRKCVDRRERATRQAGVEGRILDLQRRHAVTDQRHTFVHERVEHAAHEQPIGIIHHDRGHPYASHEVERARDRRVGRTCAANDLDEPDVVVAL